MKLKDIGEVMMAVAIGLIGITVISWFVVGHVVLIEAAVNNKHVTTLGSVAILSAIAVVDAIACGFVGAGLAGEL